MTLVNSKVTQIQEIYQTLCTPSFKLKHPEAIYRLYDSVMAACRELAKNQNPLLLKTVTKLFQTYQGKKIPRQGDAPVTLDFSPCKKVMQRRSISIKYEKLDVRNANKVWEATHAINRLSYIGSGTSSVYYSRHLFDELKSPESCCVLAKDVEGKIVGFARGKYLKFRRRTKCFFLVWHLVR